MKLEMSMMAGPESKAFLVELTQVVARLETALKSVGGGLAIPAAPQLTVAPVSAAPVAAESDDDFMAPPKKTAPAPAIEDDFMAPPKPKAEKAKKVTLAEVNDACRARASGGKRDEVLAILRKNFNTESISELKPDQYAQALALMKG